MLGPIGSNLMTILKVLTPSEIERYSQEGMAGASEVVRKSPIALAAGGEFFNLDDDENSPANPKNQTKAKILPLRRRNEKEEEETPEEDPYAGFPKVEEKEESEEIAAKSESFKPLVTKEEEHLIAKSVSTGSDLEQVGILSGNQIKQIEEQKKKKAEAKKDSATIFLLKQRRKMQESKSKLIEQSAISNYKKSGYEKVNVQIDIDDDDIDEKLKNNSPSSGILVNKKTY